MPTWGQILHELNATPAPAPAGGPDFDGVRRKYLAVLRQQTGRAVILYGTSFLEGKPVPAANLQISLGDVQGFMEAVSNVREQELDLIIHSPGGLAEATESIVRYLRTRFKHIRAIVPLSAMSAATMLALAADEIVMGSHSQLGPIDPQFVLATPEGPRAAPAQAIIDQFEQAKTDCKDPSNLAAWTPILRGYGPGLLAQCEHQKELAVELVGKWLAQYMFSGEKGRVAKGRKVASWFADYKRFKSHGRPVRVEDLKDLDLKIVLLEDDQALQDAVLSVHHVMMHTFAMSDTFKIIENHHGRAFIGHHRTVVVPTQAGPQPPRAERRRQKRAAK